MQISNCHANCHFSGQAGKSGRIILKNDCVCSFFITCFMPVNGEKNSLNLRILWHDICYSRNRRKNDERK